MKKLFIDSKAQKLIEKLQDNHGEIMFYQGFGCCEGSVPLCYAKKDFILGESDVCLASHSNIAIYTHKSQLLLYENTEFHLSTLPQNSNEYSLEYGLGEKFSFKLKVER